MSRHYLAAPVERRQCAGCGSYEEATHTKDNGWRQNKLKQWFCCRTHRAQYSRGGIAAVPHTKLLHKLDLSPAVFKREQLRVSRYEKIHEAKGIRQARAAQVAMEQEQERLAVAARQAAYREKQALKRHAIVTRREARESRAKIREQEAACRLEVRALRREHKEQQLAERRAKQIRKREVNRKIREMLNRDAPLHEYTPQGQTGMQDYYVEYSTARQAWCVFMGPYKERQHVAGPFALKKQAMDAAKELNNGK